VAEKRFDKPITQADQTRKISGLFSGGNAMDDKALPTPELVQQWEESVLRVPVRVKKLPHFEGLPDLERATLGSVGVDLYAAIDESICLNNLGARALIPTGIALELPVGFEAQIRPRSGLANKHGITVLNTPGTIDSDYRGEVKVILVNLSIKKFFVKRGERIAQLVIKPIVIPNFEYVSDLSMTERGSGGFGHTGK
jgi:dUTP pyrophosphatase